MGFRCLGIGARRLVTMTDPMTHDQMHHELRKGAELRARRARDACGTCGAFPKLHEGDPGCWTRRTVHAEGCPEASQKPC
jgi:hypothetical protein